MITGVHAHEETLITACHVHAGYDYQQQLFLLIFCNIKQTWALARRKYTVMTH